MDRFQNQNVLNSWKEISQYLGRGVRTVQRWERDFALPVRRPAGHVKSSVIALRSDIDQWLASRSARMLDGVSSAGRSSNAGAINTKAHARLNTNLGIMKVRYLALIESNQRLKNNLAATISLASLLRKELKLPGDPQRLSPQWPRWFKPRGGVIGIR